MSSIVPSRMIRLVLAVSIALQAFLFPAIPINSNGLISPAVATAAPATPQETNIAEEEDIGPWTGPDPHSPRYDVGEDYEPPNILPPAIPVGVRLRLDKRLIAARDTAQLTISAYTYRTDPEATVNLALDLPAGLALASRSQQQWTLPELREGNTFTKTIDLQVTEATLAALPAAFEIGVRTSAEGYRDQASTISLGVVDRETALSDRAVVRPELGTVLWQEETDRDALVVLAPSGSLTTTAELTREQLFENPVLVREPVATRQATESETGPVDVYIPWLSANGQAPAQLNSADSTAMVGGIRVYRQWRIGATKDTTRLERFDQPVTALFASSRFLAAGINPERVNLWIRRDAEHRWMEVPTEYDADNELWAASIATMGEYALAEGISSGYDMLPSMQGATTDRYTGSASYNIPLRTPSGLGGLNPNLSLSYSSAMVDNVLLNIEKRRFTQASPVGYGWDIGGLSYIARVNTDNPTGWYYSMVIDGQRADITGYPGEWHMAPNLYAFIKHSRASGQDTDEWEVAMPNGYRYTFGGESLG